MGTISRTPPSMADDEPAAKRAKNESDEDPEESEDPLDDEDDEEIIIDGETFNVYDVTHHQESRGTKESLNNPDVIRKMDCEIVGVAGRLRRLRMSRASTPRGSSRWR